MLARAQSLVALGLVLAWLAPAGAAAQREHVVRSGQTLAMVARRYHVDVWDLALASGIQPSTTLRPGHTLTVPAPHTVYVRPGQTLSEIARDHDCDADELRRLNHLRASSPLRVGQRLLLPGYEASTETARTFAPPAEPGVVTFHRRDEARRVTLVDADRRVTAEGVHALAELMRAHEDDDALLPHPRLVALLAAISDHFGGADITLVSGRREAGGYTRESSRHTRGQATDIRVHGVAMRALWDYCRTLASTGCGYYPRSSFVHVDVRAAAAQWVDWSSPGRRARYGNLDRPWPRMCRRPGRRGHRLCRREGRHVTAAEEVPAVAVLTDEARAIYPTALPVEDTDVESVETDEAEYETAVDDDEADEPALEGVPVDPAEPEARGG